MCDTPNNDNFSDEEDPVPHSPTPTATNVNQLINKAIEMLGNQRPKGENLLIKTAVISILKDCLANATHAPPPPLQQQLGQAKADDRITTIEHDIKEIKETLRNMVTQSPRSYVDAILSPGNTNSKPKDASAHIRLETAKRERLEQAKTDRAKREITLTFRNASEKAYTRLRDTNESEYAAELQDAINRSEAKGATILKLRKMPGKLLKIQCNSESEATKLQELKWEQALEGATVLTQEYGIVLHGVATQIMDTRTTTQERMKAIIQEDNPALAVQRIAPLTKRLRNPDAPTQSIVIFTRCPKTANDAIIDGVRIEGRYYAARRYNSQNQIRQCFRCQGYGHKAESCTRKITCGWCAQEHETKSCTGKASKCTHCNEEHPAWHHECPKRLKEHERLEALNAATPPLFTC